SESSLLSHEHLRPPGSHPGASSLELGIRHQTPTLIGCLFLMIRIARSPLGVSLPSNSASIGQAADSSAIPEEASNFF
ncbi:hypothetical protein, partial [Verminephrobacter aporrectodeae]